MAEVPKLNVAEVVDKFAADLEKLKLDAAHKTLPQTEISIPSFQRQGFMEKLGHSRKKWFKRFFVLRDSFLLSYNLDKSELTVEPRSCIHLANSKVEDVQHDDKICFSITTAEKDQFLFAVSTPEEKKAWIRDLRIARTITHTNMVKMAVENMFLAEEKGLADVTTEKSTSSLAIFSNKQYVKKTPLVGGAEGWLYTPGFNSAFHQQNQGIFGSKVKWAKHYFILRDSHLMMFRGGDTLTKPRGCMYLVGTETDIVEQSEDKSLFVFCCRSRQCGDMIELATHSEKFRKRWITALRIGARVTYRDFKLLLKEHELLSSAQSAKLTETGESLDIVMPLNPLDEHTDVQGQQLDPGVVQAYSAEGNPIIRDPEGRLVDAISGETVQPKDARFSETGQQLDPFNRPLPEGAVPMFTSEGAPIGVGPDGLHYLSDGTIIETTAPHHDANGAVLPQEIVDKATTVSATLNVAIKVRAHLKGEGSSAEAVDALGRTFRGLREDNEGMVLNVDGEKVPIATARVLDTTDNKMVDFKTYRNKEIQTHRDQGTTPIEEQIGTISIKVEEEEGEEKEIGSFELEGSVTLCELRTRIETSLLPGTEFVFLVDSLPLMAFEENGRLALSLGNEVTIRPRKQLEPIQLALKPKTERLEKLSVYEQQKQKERAEFEEIMNKIKAGRFLRHVDVEN